MGNAQNTNQDSTIISTRKDERVAGNLRSSAKDGKVDSVRKILGTKPELIPFFINLADEVSRMHLVCCLLGAKLCL